MIFVPGGHRQFLLWYMSLIPIAIEMMGLPWFLTYWLYPVLWPVDICSFEDRWYHHAATAFIVAILMLRGPQRVVESTFTLNKKVRGA